jgi:branched-chain amino acid transport system ATP-binding protein
MSADEAARLLEVGALHAYYGKSHVLHGVDLRVGAGEIVSLLGRNGVGRSTTARAVMGMVACEGRIEFKGEDLTRLKTYEIAHRGVGYVPESRDVFPELTVEENLMLGVKGRRPGRWSFDDMYQLFPRLAERRRVAGGLLSGGEQQMLTLARTMMGDPQFVIIDEPTEGLAPMVVELVAEFLNELKQRGVSILLIEQKLAIALDIAQRVYVMGHGTIVFEGTPAQLRAERRIWREWLEV